MIDFWRFVPGYMSQNRPRDNCWDALLNEALDRFEPKFDGGYYCYVGPFDVLVSNWPYAYGTCENSGMPTVATRKRLRRAIQQAQCSELRSRLDKLA